MKRILLIMLIPIFSFGAIEYQGYPDWENFISADFVRDIDSSGDSLWVTSNGGLVLVNIVTDEIEYFNHANSGLPNIDLEHIVVTNFYNRDVVWLSEYWLDDPDPAYLFFNGIYNWNIYHKYNSVLQNDVTHFAIDKNNEKWFCTTAGGNMDNNGGLCHLSTKWETYSIDKGNFPVAYSWYIAIDTNNYKWIAGDGNRIIKFRDKKWTIYDSGNSDFKGGRINIISVDVNNRKWIGTGNWQTNNVLTVFDDENWTTYNNTNSGIPNAPVNDIDFDQVGNAWIGTDAGLVMFDGENWTLYDSTNSGLRYNKVNAVKVCKYGNIWVGYEYQQNFRNNLGGLVKFDHKEWKEYKISSTVINEKNIYSILIDKDNELWISAGGNIFKKKDNKFERFNTPFDSLSYSGLYILGEHNGDKWFNDYGKAILKYDGENWTVFDSSSSKIFNYDVSNMTFDSEGNPWITTRGGGIAKYDGIDWIITDTSNSDIFYQRIVDIKFDNDGIMWLASYKGLMKYDGESWELFTKDNSGLINTYIIRIFIDEKNNKWIGSYEGGIHKYDGENWTVYTRDNTALYDDRVRDIKMDSNGNIWVATYWGGIAKLENDEWTVYRRGTSGLQCDNVNKIEFDQDGNLWAGTSDGLALFKSAMTSVQQQQSTVKSLINYPNPFSTSTNISYELEQSGFVSIQVFDSFGKEVASLVNKTMQSGSHTAEFNSAGLPSGTYYYTINANGKTESGKFVIAL